MMDSWGQLLRVIVEKLVSTLPNWFLRRLYPLSRLGEHIELDLRSISPVSINLGNSPRVNLYLRVTNKSPYIDVELDHLSVEIWDSQPFIKFECNEKRMIFKWQTQNPYCDTFLNEIQRNRLRELREKNGVLQVSIDASFNTPLGRIQKSMRGVSGFRADFSM